MTELTMKDLATITGLDAEDIPLKISELKNSGDLEQRVHDGEMCYFSNAGSAGSANSTPRDTTRASEPSDDVGF